MNECRDNLLSLEPNKNDIKILKQNDTKATNEYKDICL